MERMPMTEPAMHLRKARPDEAAVVGRQRVSMFVEMGHVTEEGVPALLTTATAYLERAMSEGTYHGWLMTLPDGRAVGGAGLLLRPLLPRPDALHGPEAVVLNVYVEPEFRRRGIARNLMVALLDWCRQQGIPRIVLHPTTNGQPLYESLGFIPSGEMLYRGR